MSLKWKPVSFTDERRVKHPGRGLAMDYGNSKSTAITEFCRGCMLTHGNVSDCTSKDCALFPFRPGADAEGAVVRVPGVDVPTREWYEEELRKRDPDGAKAEAARERFAASRAERGGQDSEGWELTQGTEEEPLDWPPSAENPELEW